MTSLCAAHVRNLTYTLNWHGGEFASKSRRWPSTAESRFAWALFSDLFVELFSHFWLSQSFGNVPVFLPIWGLSILFLLLLSIWVIWQKSRKSKPLQLWTSLHYLSHGTRRPVRLFFYCMVLLLDCYRLLSYSVQLQLSEDHDTVSACWVILVFSS